MSDIKSMGLYRNVDRILADLASSGFSEGDALTVNDLTPYDQYHYEGTDAVDDAISSLRASTDSRVLDVGSGLGGPARYIADRSGARVTALELQSDLHETAVALTSRANLSKLVTHLRGDILADDVVPEDAYTGIVSMLCFLHIPARDLLFANCARALRAGGSIFIDDYFARSQLSIDDEAMLADTVYCTYLPDFETYIEQIAGAGFVDVLVVDKTAEWTAFVSKRLELFRAASGDLVKRYDSATVDSLEHFYSTVVDLFQGGNLGGLRLTASLPA